jgi:hypothetical protein
MAAQIQYDVKSAFLDKKIDSWAIERKIIAPFLMQLNEYQLLIFFVINRFFCQIQIWRKYPKWRPKQEKSFLCPQMAKFH